MNYFTVVTAGVVVCLAGLTVGSPATQIKDSNLVHVVSVGLHKLLASLSGDSDLRQNEYLDPLPIPSAFIDLSTLGIEDLTGHLSWEDSEVTGLSKVNLPSPEWTENTEAGTAMLMWSGDIPSLLLKTSGFDFEIRYSNESVDTAVLIANGTKFEGGINNFAASLHAEGPFNEQEVSLADLMVDIGIQFEMNGEGEVIINGETGTVTYWSGSLNTLFASVWNGWNKPLIQNYLKCAINVAVDGCTKPDMATCQGTPGFNNPECMEELAEFKLDPNANSAGSVVVSLFSKIVMLFAIIWKLC